MVTCILKYQNNERKDAIPWQVERVNQGLQNRKSEFITWECFHRVMSLETKNVFILVFYQVCQQNCNNLTHFYQTNLALSPSLDLVNLAVVRHSSEFWRSAIFLHLQKQQVILTRESRLSCSWNFCLWTQCCTFWKLDNKITKWDSPSQIQKIKLPNETKNFSWIRDYGIWLPWTQNSHLKLNKQSHTRLMKQKL